MIAPVNKIIDSSIVDGPGNRTAVFFQECNFNCRYCHNPETINMCKTCGQCVKKCPAGALMLSDGKVIWDETKCCGCDTCIKTCKFNASPKISYMTVEQVWQRIEPNMFFIRGITVSGGECTLQIDFLKELFKKVHENGLTALIDSNGSFDFERNPEILNICDGVMLDIKAGANDKHEWLTGVNNKLVLKNAEYLASVGKLSEIRTVCIPEYLDSKETIRIISEVLRPYLDTQDITYKLIKYRRFGVREEHLYLNEPDDAYMNDLKDYASSLGFKKIILI